MSDYADPKVVVIRSRRGTEDSWVVDPPEDSGVSQSSSSLEELLGRRRPDLIVLDLEIPIHHGVELLRTVTSACPEAEVMTRVDSWFFLVKSRPSGLSLEPFPDELVGYLPASVFG